MCSMLEYRNRLVGRLHNNANVCGLPARFIAYEEAQEIVDRFLVTEFEGGRHQRRIEKIPLKKGYCG